MRPQVVTTTALVNGTTNIASAVTLGAAGNLTLNGSLVSGTVAYLYGTADATPQGQKISITGTGNNSGVTATITGTDPGGASKSEAITLANNGTVVTTTYFRTVSNIAVSAALTGNIDIGWLSANGGATREFYLDRQQLPGNTELNATLVSSGTATAQYSVTVRDPQSASSYASNATWQSVDGLTAVSATASSNLAYNAVAVRLTFTGAWTFTAIQGNPY